MNIRPLSSLLLLLWTCIACNSPLLTGTRRSPHEQYSGGLTQAGLAGTELGISWMKAAEESLTRPTIISLPYRETGFFAQDKPVAAGFSFRAKKGERLELSLNTTPASGPKVFIELWEMKESGRSLVAFADTTLRRLDYEVESTGTYIARIQPELLIASGYTLIISTAPSLAFPVRKQDNPKAQSFWGADRDGGGRSHEGVDIFAKKRTPAIAIAAGRITRVNENTLGGKVVWMRPDGKDYTLYYAHLDSQLVNEGQHVSTGDVIGLIGNTGNARTTPSHLHFGIYAGNGAIDPWPFINADRPAARPFNTDVKLVNQVARSGNNDGVVVVAALFNQYRIRKPDGTSELYAASSISVKTLRREKLVKTVPLLAAAADDAAVIRRLPAGTSFDIIATSGPFFYGRSGSGTGENEQKGWIRL